MCAERNDWEQYLPQILDWGHTAAIYKFLLDKILKWWPIYFDFQKLESKKQNQFEFLGHILQLSVQNIKQQSILTFSCSSLLLDFHFR